MRSEWRNFADSTDDPSRASRVNEWLPSGGLATDIATLPTGPNGQPGAERGMLLISTPRRGGQALTESLPELGGGSSRMAQWQRRIQLSSRDQNLLATFDKITHIAEILNLNMKIKVILGPPRSALHLTGLLS